MNSTLKRVAIVAPHFVPSNLAGVHRARLWAQSLAEFGWQPIIVTTDSRYYEERLDPDLEKLLAPDLRVIRTRALPTRPIRLIGDIGVRALPWHYRALAKLAARGEIDFVHVTIPSNFSALLGRMIHARYGIPYGIDYIDPWVHNWPGTDKKFSKAWWSCRLGDWLEPWAVKNASLITGVAPRYYEAVLERNPHLRNQAITAAMPYGASALDFESVRAEHRPPFLFDPLDGNFHMIYAGAMLPKAYPVLERLFEAIVHLSETSPATVARLRLHFIGTGKHPDDPNGYNIKPLIDRYGLSAYAEEKPTRVGYFDVLNHLQHASAILVVGSTEAHYTPSKIFQSIQSGRPVLALLHAESTAVDVLKKSRGGTAITLTESELPSVEALAIALQKFIDEAASFDPSQVDHQSFASFSARASAEKLAIAMDQALDLRA